MKFIPHYTIIFLLGIPLSSKGQPAFVEEWQAWFRYYNQTQLNPKFSLHTELDERRRLNPASQFQFFVHLHLHYRVKPWLDVAAGMNYNVTDVTSGQRIEWRPWQEVNLVKKLGKDWQFQFRYRLDERFIHGNGQQVPDETQFNLRHRFRIQFIKPLAEFKDIHTLSLKLFDEVMINSGDVIRTFDQNRLSAALEYKFNDHWSIESGYINLIQQITDDVFSERHVIRTTLYHRLAIKR